MLGDTTSTYVVQEDGETLNSIAVDVMGGTVTPEELLELNPELGLEEQDPDDPCNVVLPVDTEVVLPEAEDAVQENEEQEE